MKAEIKYSFSRIFWSALIWWFVWALVQSTILHRLGFFWETALIDSFISAALMAFFCFDAIAIFHFYQPGKGNDAYRFVFAFGISVLYAVVVRWVLSKVFFEDADYKAFLEKSMPVRFIISLLVLLFVTLFYWLWNNLKEQKEKVLRQNIAEQLVKEAELAKLQQQLQPHFLFNSLNSISALAGTRPAEARKMIQQLSDFLRGTLTKDDQQTVAFKDEIEHLKLYLEIEKVRFSHRLNINLNFSDDSLVAKTPPLLLQPIVENAIKFGLYDTIGDITIQIKSFIQNDLLIVEVENPFDEDTRVTQQGTGFGLMSIQRRLFLLYSRNDLLTTQKKNNQFIASLKIPQTI